MATYEKHDVHMVRHEYRIPYPANWAEVQRAMSAVRTDLNKAGLSEYDDAAFFEPHDEYVLIHWGQDLPDAEPQA
jgi:hypothetical protein